MSRIRLLGPRERLEDTLRVLQDLGRVQLDDVAPAAGLEPVGREARSLREERYLRRLLADADAIVALLRLDESRVPGAAAPARPTQAAASPTAAPTLRSLARRMRRARHEAERLEARRVQLDDERTMLQRYRGFLDAFRSLLAQLAGAPHLGVYGVTLPGSERDRVDRLADRLRQELGVDVVVVARALASGDIAVLLAVPEIARERIEHALASAHIAEVPLPGALARRSLSEAAPEMLRRLESIPGEIDTVERERRSLADRDGDAVRAARELAHDRLTALGALRQSARTTHAFAVEGWLPSSEVRGLRERVARDLGGEVLVEELARETWRSETPAPVVLTNPRIFRPFETLTALMPLPRYGSIDPTPFVAIGFPMLFGMILGDVGYGLLLAALALTLRHRSRAGSPGFVVGEIAIPCAAFAVIFGVLYGELFGPLGHEWFGMRPVLMNREEAVVAAILVAVGVGLAHTLLGLVLGIVSTWRGERRVALSRSVQLVMVVLVVLSLLAAVRVLPAALFTPFGIAVLIGFPVLLVIEGIVAPIEFFSTLGSILSYVRIMALGTASVLLASVAHQMVGMFGSAVVGVLFALLFHLVNFALGLLSPTLHALRLHYVEFFRQFYSPGGRRYEPFTHWRPEPRRAP